VPLIDKTINVFRSAGLLPDEIDNDKARRLLTYGYGLTDDSTVSDAKNLIERKNYESETPLKPLLKLKMIQKFRQLKTLGISDDMTLSELREWNKKAV
jgi:hypothetical protein